ncbi:PREDICTED: uncharacterized protein C4orf19-like [Elephantulus edwardii]|uniref:uncharacterized protein C4orf19-like n=1 Tax=Elephantulus edwardii TaxID=28737 RepID=UPI0003F0E8DD|nr:PREDICTED: uncharacterized protein C4orf19-like [Elephantulus edwardii]
MLGHAYRITCGKLKDRQSSEVLVHKNDLQSEGLKRTESRSRTASGREPRWSHRGPLPPGDPSGENSLDNTANDSLPMLPFLEGGDTRKQDGVLPAVEDTHVIQNGDSGVSSNTESLTLDVQDHIIQIPAPDYPQLWGSAVDSSDHEEKDCLFQNHAENEHLDDIVLHGMDPSTRERWDSLSEGMATQVLSGSFEEEDVAHAVPVVDAKSGQEGVHGCSGDGNGEMVEEDAAVAEALAALEAATAGEDTDEVY